MPSNTIRKLTIGNKSFSLNALIANPDAYLPLMQQLVSTSVFERKASETSDQYFTRLFNLLYSKQSRRSNIGNTATRAPRTSIPLDENCNAILSALGILRSKEMSKAF